MPLLLLENLICGSSSVVERHVANVNVAGSSPVSRSNISPNNSARIECRSPNAEALG